MLGPAKASSKTGPHAKCGDGAHEQFGGWNKDAKDTEMAMGSQAWCCKSIC